MKIANCIAVAGLVQAGLASAIPARHEKHHNQRRDTAPPAVVTVTQTFYQTVMWVDSKGNTVSTEVNTPPPGAETAPPPTSSTSPVASPAASQTHGPNLAGFAAQKRPSQAPAGSASPSKPSFVPLNLPSSSASHPSQSANVANLKTGNTQDGSTAPGGMGICYDMIDSNTQCKQPGTINSEFQFLQSQGYGIVRIYDIGCPIGDFVAAAAQHGIKLMVGINGIGGDMGAGDLAKLIGMVNGNWGSIDTVYVGNELVNNGIASPGSVAAAVSQAKGVLSGAGFTGNVVTVDTFNAIQSHPEICSTSDYCAANAHAFFDPNTSADKAGSFVLNAYNRVQQAVGGKKVVITESGWPWQGSCNGQACPSVENQKTAMSSIMSSFSGMPGNIFMFQAYNAGYKHGGNLGVEQFFGIYDTDHYTGGIGPS